MRKANSGTQHTITSVRKDRNGEVLKVTVRLPMKFGWFERVRLNVVSNASFDLNSVQYDILMLGMMMIRDTQFSRLKYI